MIDTVKTCPGCDAWQVDFDSSDVLPHEEELILREHARECRPLQMMLVQAIFSAGPNELFR